MLLGNALKVGSKTIKNRIVVPPMADFGATGADGLVNVRHLRHYGAFAIGGAGLVIIEACTVSPFHESRNTIGLYDDKSIPGMTLLAKASRQNGALAIVQLLNGGVGCIPEHSINDISLSALRGYGREFLDAARRCRQAGFDGVELHAAHGYFLNQMMERNNRTDEYGGTLENRLRLLTEVIAEIKAECGGDFLVAVRFGASDMSELSACAKSIEASGGDLLDVSSGFGRYAPPADFPYDGKIYAASVVKRNAGIPVICVGNIRTGNQAEDLLKKGYADLVAVGRGHLCDSAWAAKALGGQTPTPCLGCRHCLWYVDGHKCPARRGK